MMQAGSTWTELTDLECSTCAKERGRRNRIIEPQDPRISQKHFVDALYVNPHNDPKYHACLVRAEENAKRGAQTPSHVLWVIAEDSAKDATQVAKTATQMQRKRRQWLKYHDQKTGGIPSLLPLYKNMKARVTEKHSLKLGILKHTSCIVVGWSLHPADRHESQPGARVLSHQPLCIYLKFPGASFKIGDLEPGVFP